MNDLLDLLACMDWITPLLSLLDGSVETISLNQDELWAVDELKRRKVKVKRLMTVPFGRIAFDVPVAQVELAALLLRQMGIAEPPAASRRSGRSVTDSWNLSDSE